MKCSINNKKQIKWNYYCSNFREGSNIILSTIKYVAQFKKVYCLDAKESQFPGLFRCKNDYPKTTFYSAFAQPFALCEQQCRR